MNNLVGDVKANLRDFYRYINSQKKDTQGIPPLKRKNGKGVAQSDLEKAEEFNGQFTDVFSKNEHTQEELESVQKRAARFVTGNYNYETWSMTGILGQLKWESLKKRRKDNRLILLYKGLEGKAGVPTDNLIPKTRRCRNQHSMAFQTPIANTDVYKGSFFPQTIRDWNVLPDSLNPLKMQRIVLLSSLLW